MYTTAHTRTPTYKHTCTQLHINTHVHTYACTQMNTDTQTHTHTPTHPPTHTHTHRVIGPPGWEWRACSWITELSLTIYFCRQQTNSSFSALGSGGIKDSFHFNTALPPQTAFPAPHCPRRSAVTALAQRCDLLPVNLTRNCIRFVDCTQTKEKNEPCSFGGCHTTVSGKYTVYSEIA